MTTETTPDMVTVPKISVYGAGDLNRLRKFEYQGKVGREIVDFNTRYADLQGDTITLRDQATLFQEYLHIVSERGLNREDPFENVLHYLFVETGKGNVTRDICDYNNGDKSMRKTHETDRRVLWEIIGEEKIPILVPKEGFVKWTNDGGYRPDTGTPFETGSEQEAIQSMIDHGIPESVATRTRSYFWSRGEDKGTAAVYCYSGDGGGPFIVDADRSPSYGFPSIGRLPASRSPSGARQADSSRFSVLADELEGFAARLRGTAKD